MISCLLIHLSRNSNGIPVGKEFLVSGETLTIGRGAASKIHLPDHQVHLHHALLRRSEDGSIYIYCEKDIEINVNGAMAQSTTLDIGTEIEIGPYALKVLPKPEDHDICLSVELLPAHLLERETAMAKQHCIPLTIAALGVSKRRLGWVSAIAILVMFVALPLLPALSSGFDRWQAGMPIALNESWSPGELASEHDVLGGRCTVCHQQPFRPISDDVCLECHKNTASHWKQEAMHGKLSVNMRCTNCHLDHKGKQGLVLHDSSRCVRCHGNLKVWQVDTRLADVSDFETGHPSFHPSLPEISPAQNTSSAQQAPLRESNGLKFSHQIHLADKGVSSPQGDTVMVCHDCHRLEQSGLHFAPIEMKRDCRQSGCHGQVFSEPMEGRVPHGSIRAVTSLVREFYLGQILGQGLPAGGACVEKSKVDCASLLSNHLLAKTLFRKKLECGECHEISGGERLDSWQFTPVKINRDWFPKSIFSHAQHGAFQCDNCHAKKNSRSSADVSMPEIGKCRECHVGERSAKHQLSTRCDNCHVFHVSIKPVINLENKDQ